MAKVSRNLNSQDHVLVAVPSSRDTADKFEVTSAKVFVTAAALIDR